MLLFTEFSNIPSHDGDHSEHNEHSNRATSSRVAASTEHPVKHQVGKYLGSPLAVGHCEHNVENFQHNDGDCRPDHNDRAHNLWDHDQKKDLELTGPINLSGFQCFLGHSS